MSDASWERIGAATGVLAVILTLVGFAVIPTLPDVDAPAIEIGSYFAEEQDGVRTGLAFITVGLFFFIWFLGSLRAALRVAEGGEGRVSAIAFGGGLVTAGALFVLLTLLAAAAFRPGETTPEVTTALNDAAVVSGGPAFAGLAALLAATAKVMLRTGAFPPLLGWVNALAALAQPLAIGAMLTDSGAFAGDGVLGLYLPILSFSVAILATALVLIRRAGAPASVASPSASTTP